VFEPVSDLADPKMRALGIKILCPAALRPKLCHKSSASQSKACNAMPDGPVSQPPAVLTNVRTRAHEEAIFRLDH
jgi:hypothetical protein